MIEQKTIKISNTLYNKYCNSWSHYYDPIELHPQDKDIIEWFSKQGLEGKKLSLMARSSELKIYSE
jgi:hypothetical protein